ncbi:Similar to UNC93-like protein C922.05c; acc. no. Q9URX1 [Pyronema omphalodes CBS 100304]|uniref:Similar to UNC93-like protein C922.05c acc. no. Q9URX1 n=1 Tax=Pyronema omphalodes (strain CBS 100304) TaxID=1076935 RepID=U4LE41_PYROM|nr:Similar to UNC93-like protein C922.05c; acc. no. Q9URX1 [Pyronema omphalodes CBS 100304]
MTGSRPSSAVSSDKKDDESFEAPGEVVEYLPQRKAIKIGPISLPPWRSPTAQITLIGFVCFLCTGMFNALNGIGGGGQIDSSVSAASMTAIYPTFTIVGFTAGSFLNYFGAKITLGIGGLGYAVYSAAYLCYNHTHNKEFVIFSGVLLGICAAFIWCAHGTIMMSYPAENEKGKFIGIFWAIFNSGAVLGSLVPLVNDATYIGFLVLMAMGGILAWFLVPPEKVIRSDGSRVQPIRNPSAIAEIRGLYDTLVSETYILLLFPYFIASNWFYTYEQNSYNLYMFNTRTRSFTGLWYWLSQIGASLLFGHLLDNAAWPRRKRAIAGWVVLFLMVNGIWGGGLKADLQMSRPPRPEDAATWYRGMDVYDKGFGWYCLLYIAYGMLDAVWQTYAYWLMGALSNEPRKLAYFAGFYKGIQAAGSAVAWGLDSARVSYRVLFLTSWGWCVAGMLFLIPVIWIKINDTGRVLQESASPEEIERDRDDEKNHAVDSGM